MQSGQPGDGWGTVFGFLGREGREEKRTSGWMMRHGLRDSGPAREYHRVPLQGDGRDRQHQGTKKAPERGEGGSEAVQAAQGVAGGYRARSSRLCTGTWRDVPTEVARRLALITPYGTKIIENL